MASRPGRSGRRGQDHTSPLVDLDLVFADDRLIDRIAQGPWGPAEQPSSGGAHRRSDAGLPVRSDLATVEPLAQLFETWRDELAAEPMPALPKLRPAMLPEPVGKPVKRRSLRPALSVAAAIAALLVGSATVGSKNADPESALWGITQVVWPARVQSVASVKAVKEQLERAQTALDAGRSRDAQMALIAATVELGKIDPVDGQEDMTRRVRDLMVTATDQAVAATQDSNPTGTSTSPSVDLSTLFGTTAPSTLIPPPLVLATTSDPAPSDLAGGTVGAPAQPPVVQDPVLLPGFVQPAPPPVVIPLDPAPSSEAPVPSSEPVPATDPPPSPDVPPSDETTSVPPPDPVESTAPVDPPASAEQSAPEQSPPAPTPLAQSPTLDPGTSVADPGSYTEPTLATGS